MNIFEDDEAVKTETADSLLVLFKQDQNAVNFCMELLYVYHLWDDLVDGDKERSKESINHAFMSILTQFQRNPFYRHYQDDLLPLITSTILQWFDANQMEKGNLNDLRKAFMLRAAIIQVWAYCAYLIGGVDYYLEVGPTIQRMYEEDFDEFVGEMTNA